ncbi:MAG TPA: type III pantothenate kinase [Gemmatimonadaceae bacterium]
MIIVFDVGNTETTIGLFDADRLRAHWRITTDATRTPDEIGLLLCELLRSARVDATVLRGAAIGSVVPPATQPLVAACAAWLEVDAVVVDARAPLPIVLQVDEPLTVGADRIINTLAASRMFERDCVIVDFGTATTYDCITADGVFLGGVIAPGLRTAAETLTRRTSQLPATELAPPARVIGKRTDECIRAGVMLGAADSIDGLVRRIKAEWPTASVPLVMATGGLAELVAPLCREVERVEPYLTLHGLRIAHALLDGRGVGRGARGA